MNQIDTTMIDASMIDYQHAFEAERSARLQAERKLETRSSELSAANRELQRRFDEIQSRSIEMQHAHARLQQAQAQLVQSEKMASVGQLAAGIAHEINNPMAFIASNISTLGKYLQSVSIILNRYHDYQQFTEASVDIDARVILDDIDTLKREHDLDFILDDFPQMLIESRDGAARVTEIVQGLRNFSRLDDSELTDADLNECIETTIKVAWNELKYKCEVDRRYSELPQIRCRAGQINQVILNLLINAAQAIEQHGTITIETRCDDHSIYLSVHDTGLGISKDNLSKIFNPFFTTKEIGKGTGLGLSISYAIVEKHGGKLTVDSELGHGATFTIQLPRDRQHNVAVL
jgi:two-component system, NtrC family, sensor kinase